ncbi:putative disease resistance protein, partial [Mucuna pruriens]
MKIAKDVLGRNVSSEFERTSPHSFQEVKGAARFVKSEVKGAARFVKSDKSFNCKAKTKLLQTAMARKMMLQQTRARVTLNPITQSITLLHNIPEPMTDGKPMSDNNTSQTKYDVFVNFRGKDICYGFLSHLIKAFERNKIYAFLDYQLEKGEEIGHHLEKYEHIVIPVFYKVEPTVVGHQSSDSYRNAFAENERKYEKKVQIWRDALNETAKISGIVSSTFP